MSWSLVLITLLEAEKPVEATIRFVNSVEMSTLLNSSEPERTAPAPRVSGLVMTRHAAVGGGGEHIAALVVQTLRVAKRGDGDLAQVARQAVAVGSADDAIGADRETAERSQWPSHPVWS